MFGLNVDPRNIHADPHPSELASLGVKAVRFTFKDSLTGRMPDREAINFYRRKLEALTEAGIACLIVLTGESYPNKPAVQAPEDAWADYAAGFAGRAVEIARAMKTWQPAFQIWNAPDHVSSSSRDEPTLSKAVYGHMLAASFQAIKDFDPDLSVVTAGLVSGQPAWLAELGDLVGDSFPADAVALHPYTKRPEADWPDSDWGTGEVGDLIEAYQQVVNLPFWITEIGVDTLNNDDQAEYLRRFHRTVQENQSNQVEKLFWFCYGDGMAHHFGLVDLAGRPKPAYHAFREVNQARESVLSAAARPAVSLNRLHEFARYLEQSIVFGEHDRNLQQQLEAELRGNWQRLSGVDIWRISQRLAAGSTFDLNQTEIEMLYALQERKDLYGFLRSIVLTVHQQTGALTGRVGVHVRISAETDANASTNVEAVMKILQHLQPGNRMIMMDMVKATADEGKLRAPDIFETNVYGQHRNGLVDNHAWNLQRLVRAIRDRGYQDRVILMIRLDGPDDGANVNPFNPDSIRKYELAIAKLIRYLEVMLPTVPFKISLGNEPDLPKERQWSKTTLDPRTYILEHFAAATGAFMKKVARQRPDVAFLCPALSANLKNEQLGYYTNFFGQVRPENLVPALHGYAADVATLPFGQRNLLEQQAELLRALGKFEHISGTEIGSGNPFGDTENLSEKGRFDDAIIWLLLSTDHRAPLGQDNHWNFRIDPRIDDPTARHLADVMNRSKKRVLRNIRERGGVGLQIIRDQPVELEAYAVDYLDHNVPDLAVAGQTNAVQITLRNTSYRTWPAGGPHPVRIGYHWYTPTGEDVPNTLWDDLRTNLPHDIQPGDSVTLNCEMAVPRAPGSYEIRWDMVEEMRTWFAWQAVPTLDVEITVRSEPVEEPPDIPPEPEIPEEPEPPAPPPDPEPPEEPEPPETPPPPAEPEPQPPEPPEPEIPEPPARLSLISSHHNRLQGPQNLLQAIDGNPYTRWSTQQPQQPGMWLRIDLGESRTVSQVSLNHERSPADYPRGYIVNVSQNGQEWITVAERPVNDRSLQVTFSPREIRFINIEQTNSDPVYWWSVHTIEISSEVKISARSNHNNVQVGADNLAQALDGRPETRWSSRALQRPGMWIELDLHVMQAVSGLALDTGTSTSDYPDGYVVRLSTNGQNWEAVARRDQNNRALDVNFSPRSARHIRIEQTGRSDRWWWSIHEVTVRSEAYRPDPVARSSHNNVQVGVDNLTQALDGRPETRWSSGTPQRPGTWFELDLQETQTVSGLTLDTGTSTNDYPHGYVVRLSTDGQNWEEVARRDQNDQALDVNFSPRSARYIRVEQTGQADRWWWSIHEVTVRSEAYRPDPVARSSHNNVQVGVDNLAQALDGRPETRWSSGTPQRPGMWFELDLQETQTVSRLALDTGTSTNDYPHGYVVRLSTDGQNWEEVARRDQNDQALDVSFSPRSARYIRIEQTGRADRWWWSIHEVTIRD